MTQKSAPESAFPPPPGESAKGILILCRPGFEPEARGETGRIAESVRQRLNWIDTESNGMLVGKFNPTAALPELESAFPLDRLVFARQRLIVFGRVAGLPSDDRATPICEALGAHGLFFSRLVIETPDSDQARPLSGFCRRFQAPLERLLEKRAILRPRRSHLPELHVVFSDGETAWLAMASPGAASAWPMGIPRLKMPREAPSRSTLKLVEAFETLLSEEERVLHLRAGLRAVDLGAAPGGWSWQLAQRGLFVTAIDNGPLAREVLATEMVEHVRADGFIWRPPRPVEWMVCDMVEQPARIAQLVAEWVATGRCRRSIFNLKLPMKRRLEEVQRCREAILRILAPIAPVDLRFKQLYHDREEITGYLALQR